MKKIGFLVFIAALVLGLVFANIGAVQRLSKDGIDLSFGIGRKKGSGNIAIEQRDLGRFHAVDSSGVFVVEIMLGREHRVEVEADDNLLPYIETDVRRGVLHLSTDGKLRSANPLRVRIFTDTLDGVSCSGASEMSVVGLEADEFRVDGSGAARITIRGHSRSLRVESSGAARIDASELDALDVTADASGASEVTVNLKGTLNAEASGASRVVYKGSPVEIFRRASGGGRVVPFE
jgi:hypothetical protein